MDERDRQDIVDRLIGVGRPDLAKRYKHLSGKHDQRTHGWRYAKGGSDADRLSAARRSMRGTSAEQRATYRKRAGMPTPTKRPPAPPEASAPPISGVATNGKVRQIGGKKYNTAEVVNQVISESNRAKLDIPGAESALRRMGHNAPPRDLVLRYAREYDVLSRIDKAIPGGNAINQIGKWNFTNASTIHDSFNSYLWRRFNAQRARWTERTRR